jgi:probable rRNA maturation factor
MIDIEISKGFKGKVETAWVMGAAQAALTELDVSPESALSILITTDQHIQELNRDYRQVDQPTDVLAFPSGHSNPEDGMTYLGDIVISYPRAAAQAGERGHLVAEEIQLLVIHGILHLLSYNHLDPEGKEQMWNIKQQVLEGLGVGPQVLGDR